MTTLFISLYETSIFRGMCRWLKYGQHRISSLSFDSANVLIRFRFMHGKHFVMFHRVEKHVRKTDGGFCAWVYGMGMYCNQKGARSAPQSQSVTRRGAKRKRHGDVVRSESGNTLPHSKSARRTTLRYLQYVYRHILKILDGEMCHLYRNSLQVC